MLWSLTQQIQNGEKRQAKKFWWIMRAFPLKQHQRSNFMWKTRTRGGSNHKGTSHYIGKRGVAINWNAAGIFQISWTRRSTAGHQQGNQPASENEVLKAKTIKDQYIQQLRKTQFLRFLCTIYSLFRSFDQCHNTVLFSHFVLFV